MATSRLKETQNYGVIVALAGAHGVILESNKILLIKRGLYGHFAGYWGIPGGGQEERESLDETVEREVKEETGLTVKVSRKLGVLTGAVSGMPQHIFLCSRISGNLQRRSSETTDAEWVPLEQIPRMKIVPYLKEFLLSLNLEKK